MPQPANDSTVAGHPVVGRPVRGLILSVVGPDGTGKSTICDALSDAIGPSSIMRFRFPRVLPRRARSRVLDERLGAGATYDLLGPRKYPSLLSPWKSAAKTLYLYADFLLGWFVRVRPHVKNGGWVIFERGWWDYSVDPGRYRLRAARPFRILGRSLPRCDLVIVLEGHPDAIRARKPQLSVEELRRQMDAWHRVLPRRQPVIHVDTSVPVEMVVDTVVDAVNALVSRRPSRDPDRARL
jgi:thymidylate kinase